MQSTDISDFSKIHRYIYKQVIAKACRRKGGSIQESPQSHHFRGGRSKSWKFGNGKAGRAERASTVRRPSTLTTAQHSTAEVEGRSKPTVLLYSVKLCEQFHSNSCWLFFSSVAAAIFDSRSPPANYIFVYFLFGIVYVSCIE